MISQNVIMHKTLFTKLRAWDQLSRPENILNLQCVRYEIVSLYYNDNIIGMGSLQIVDTPNTIMVGTQSTN